MIELISRIRRQRAQPTGVVGSPLLVCVQKYDVWRTLLPFARIVSEDGKMVETVDNSSIEFSREHGIAGLDIEEINRISVLVRAFLFDSAREFVELAEQTFTTVRYFPVSALGTSPELDESPSQTSRAASDRLMIRPSRITPFRVTHPILWLLFQWKLIRRMKRRTIPSSIQKCQVSIDPSTGKLRVMLPSKQIIMLDLEYSEMLIIDPHSGKKVWIPKIENDRPAITALPVEVKPTSLETLAIKPPPPLPPKRGWFEKH